ncbi:MAG TPA: hypothetical protein VI876_05135 [Dehalococcoidia bacterium]|jgi:hypothetical protein|nr:hypothetical protein [Dehalococcoidia bacterium]
MAKTGLIAAVAGLSGLLTTTQVAAANGLSDQVGVTAATLIGLGWLALLTALALAIVLPMIRH